MDRKYICAVTYREEADDQVNEWRYWDDIVYRDTKEKAMEDYKRMSQEDNFYCGAVAKVVHDSEN